MQEESELHWRSQETHFNSLSPQGRDEYAEATKNAHIMQSQHIIRSIIGINLFFSVMLMYDSWDLHRNHFIRSYGLIPALILLVVPFTLMYIARPVYNGKAVVEDQHGEDDAKMMTPLIIAKTSFDSPETTASLTVPNMERLVMGFTYAAAVTGLGLVFVLIRFGWIILIDGYMDRVIDPITNTIIQHIPISSLDALTRWELILTPIFTIVALISFLHGIVTTNELKTIITNSRVGYGVQGFYTNPDY
jgi:hypothetical protein